MEKTKEIKLKGLIGPEYPPYGPYLFSAGGIFIVLFLHLYRPDRLFLAVAILAISLFLSVAAYRRWTEVVYGSVIIKKNHGMIIIKSPFCDKGGGVQFENSKNLTVDVVTIDQMISDGVEKYYKVCVNHQSVFRSKKPDTARFVRESIWVFLNEA
jgi:hypothetical protein